jgi:tRNA pseudouridine38-40 synthase
MGYILHKSMTVAMRIALKIAYDGRVFHGYQRQPDARTVEGECLASLRGARILRTPEDGFFRSASRTDRGVSALGNVIAFNTSLSPEAVVGAFNDRARDVWAWAATQVPDSFHPRHALERWYRFHVFSDIPVSAMRDVARLFVGTHRFDSFTSDPPPGPMTVHRIDVSREGRTLLVDIRARSFRRSMVRRIVAAMSGCAEGEIPKSEIRDCLRGTRRDFGIAPPEPLFLMDIRYPFPMAAILKPKVRDEWRSIEDEVELRGRFIDQLRASVGGSL